MKTIASNASNNSKRGDTKLFLIGMPFSKRSTLIVNKKKSSTMIISASENI